MDFPQYGNATPSDTVAKPEANESLIEHVKPEAQQNGHIIEPQPPQQKRPRPRKKGPNYALIHNKPLPLEAHPLPAFHPSNPLSLLRLCYIYLSHLVYPPSSHPQHRYKGYFSPETRSVHITDPKHVRALWEQGFFGKGSLSRSEPSWLDREKARLRDARGGGRGGTAEEATNARREERRLFKLERARLEREKIERQRLVEEGKLVDEPNESIVHDKSNIESSNDLAAETDPLLAQAKSHQNQTNGRFSQPSQLGVDDKTVPRISDVQVIDTAGTRLQYSSSQALDVETEPEPNVENQEHLQLTLEEALFLSYALGVLDIVEPSDTSELNMTPSDQVRIFAQHASFPPTITNATPASITLAPDNQFLLNYVVYHHFRSLGWVIRPGVKFSVDYMLYHRGPVFSHAEFAVLIMPAYSHPYWATGEGWERRRIKDQKDWWWLHCINRVQSQVRKTLVLCYVDIPPPSDQPEQSLDIGALLKGYKVREILIRRWLANRSRD